MARKDVVEALEELRKEQDKYGMEIVDITPTRNRVIVAVDDNPLIPQAVFAVMQCFIKGGAIDADWKATDEGIDLIAIT